MNVTNGFQSALMGVRAGMQSMQNHAENIASTSFAQGEKSSSLVESLVGLKQDQLQVMASMQVIQSLDDVIGTLLDVKA